MGRGRAELYHDFEALKILFNTDVFLNLSSFCLIFVITIFEIKTIFRLVDTLLSVRNSGVASFDAS